MDEPADSVAFHELELDERILKGIVKLGWQKPTLIQSTAIPLVLEGKDVLIRARTGSGKTGAFGIPLIQKILNSKQVSREQELKALVIAPSKELCQQIHRNFLELTVKCSQEVTCMDISTQNNLSHSSVLVNEPDIVVATPSRALECLEKKIIDLKTLELLVIDEADLVFSFGYEDDAKKVFKYLPRVYQAVLASATLSDDVLTLKKIVLHNPVTLKLEEPDLAPTSQLTHYHMYAEENEKATILYVLLKMRLIRGKTIIFVNTVNKCYKLKLYLEQFSISSCVLNSELPAAIRCLSVVQFNEGLYDIIIASDEKVLEEPANHKDSKKYKQERTKCNKDRESGVSRGIDFQCVSSVINFDFPLDVGAYIHRAGRTARGNNEGNVLSFVSMGEKLRMQEVEEHLKSVYGGKENIFRKYEFRMEEIESFRYRTNDTWHAVTRGKVREARLKEIKTELFNCKKLKGYFADNPRDLQTLRHDQPVSVVKRQPHLTNVPDYIVPPALKRLASMPFGRKKKSNKVRNMRKGKAHFRYEGKKNNPLLRVDLAKSKGK